MALPTELTERPQQDKCYTSHTQDNVTAENPSVNEFAWTVVKTVTAQVLRKDNRLIPVLCMGGAKNNLSLECVLKSELKRR